MAFEWYVPVGITFAALLVTFFVIFFILKCCCKKKGKKRKYSQVPQDEHRDVIKKPLKESSIYMTNGDKNKSDVTSVHETLAEVAASDAESDDLPMSAYGDQISFVSLESKASWLTLSAVANLNSNIQTSLIYSRDMKYVAGKIIQIDGLTFTDHDAPLQVKVHVVVLPIKKYAIKTHWYDIRNSRSRIDEYFKFKFKLPPAEHRVMFRFRVYGRKQSLGVFGRPRCVGECYISLTEIISARGGLTIWRGLTRGVPESIPEEK